jgi:hypothetical protein
MKETQTMPGTDTDSDHNVLVAKIHTKLKKTTKFQGGGGGTMWDLEKLQDQRQRVLRYFG